MFSFHFDVPKFVFLSKLVVYLVVSTCPHVICVLTTLFDTGRFLVALSACLLLWGCRLPNNVESWFLHLQISSLAVVVNVHNSYLWFICLDHQLRPLESKLGCRITSSVTYLCTFYYSVVNNLNIHIGFQVGSGFEKVIYTEKFRLLLRNIRFFHGLWLIGGNYRRMGAPPNLGPETRSPQWKPLLAHRTIILSFLLFQTWQLCLRRWHWIEILSFRVKVFALG